MSLTILGYSMVITFMVLIMTERMTAMKGYGIAPEVIARPSLIGQPVHQLSPLVAANYVLIGLSGVEFGAHQRFTLKWAFVLMFVMLIVAGLTGVIPIL